jgi:hypothetical protein
MKILLILFLLLTVTIQGSKGVTIVENKGAQQLDVSIDGKLFTSYCYWDSQKKPILYPLRTASGTIVTRGFPLENRGRARRSSAPRLRVV